MGEEGGYFCVEGLAGDLSEAVDSKSRKVKDLYQEAEEVPINGGMS